MRKSRLRALGWAGSRGALPWAKGPTAEGWLGGLWEGQLWRSQRVWGLWARGCCLLGGPRSLRLSMAALSSGPSHSPVAGHRPGGQRAHEVGWASRHPLPSHGPCPHLPGSGNPSKPGLCEPQGLAHSLAPLRTQAPQLLRASVSPLREDHRRSTCSQRVWWNS